MAGAAPDSIAQRAEPTAPSSLRLRVGPSGLYKEECASSAHLVLQPPAPAQAPLAMAFPARCRPSPPGALPYSRPSLASPGTLRGRCRRRLYPSSTWSPGCEAARTDAPRETHAERNYPRGCGRNHREESRLTYLLALLALPRSGRVGGAWFRLGDCPSRVIVCHGRLQR